MLSNVRSSGKHKQPRKAQPRLPDMKTCSLASSLTQSDFLTLFRIGVGSLCSGP